MQFKKTFTISTILASSAIASYIPGDEWEVLIPTATYKNAITDHPHDFGIAVVPLSTSSTSSSNPQKRNVAPVSQIGDGQIQAPTSDPPRPTVPAVSQIGDGQIQAPPKTTVPAVSQIGDGQIQAPPSDPPRPTVPAVSQIGDGQIQAPPSDPPRPTVPAVSQIGDGQIQAPPSDPPRPTVPAVSQIGDGQIQAPPSDPPRPTVPAVSQIGDGQIQAPPSDPPKPTVPAVSQIGDGQIQATKSTTTLKPDGQVSQISDGQPQATDAPKPDEQIDPSDPVKAVSCKTDGTLQLKLKDSVLRDEHGRIGSIVANRQFQFDGPPPQAGTIYAKGWSITPEGNLALGDKDIFFQCLSGNFYNLYDESIGGQCSEVHLQAIDLVTC